MEVKPECHDKCRMAEWRQGESRNLELTHDPTTTLNIVLILHNEGREEEEGQIWLQFSMFIAF